MNRNYSRLLSVVVLLTVLDAFNLRTGDTAVGAGIAAARKGSNSCESEFVVVGRALTGNRERAQR